MINQNKIRMDLLSLSEENYKNLQSVSCPRYE